MNKHEKIMVAFLITAIIMASVAVVMCMKFGTSEEKINDFNFNEFGDIGDLNIFLPNKRVNVGMEKHSYLGVCIENPTNRSIELGNCKAVSLAINGTISEYLDAQIYANGWTYVFTTYEIENSSSYFTRFSLGDLLVYSKIAPNMKMFFTIEFSLEKNFWKRPYRHEYRDNYVVFSEYRQYERVWYKKLGFSILIGESFDPNDFDISFDGEYDFSDVINENGIVTKNTTITHTLTIYNPTYRNSTYLLLAIDDLYYDLENDKFVVKAGNTFLYREYITGYYYDWQYHREMPKYHIYENMTIDPIPSLSKIEIPISISFLKCGNDWFMDGLIYEFNLLLYSGCNYVEIPVKVIT